MSVNPISLPTPWSADKQQRLDALHAKELAGIVTASERRELARLIAEVEAEERARLAPGTAQMQREQALLRRQVRQSQANNEQLVMQQRTSKHRPLSAAVAAAGLSTGVSYHETQRSSTLFPDDAVGAHPTRG